MRVNVIEPFHGVFDLVLVGTHVADKDEGVVVFDLLERAFGREGEGDDGVFGAAGESRDGFAGVFLGSWETEGFGEMEGGVTYKIRCLFLSVSQL